MAVTIRLARHGRKKRPFYRIMATDNRNPRDGRYIEQLGTLNPLTDPATVTLKEDRVKYWVGVGAQPSPTMASVIEREYPGYLKDITEGRLKKLQAKRAKRKARAKK